MKLYRKWIMIQCDSYAITIFQFYSYAEGESFENKYGEIL